MRFQFPSLRYAFFLVCVSAVVPLSFYGCQSTAKEAALTENTNPQRLQNDAQTPSGTSSSEGLQGAASNTLAINEATVVLSFEKPLPEKICGRFVPAELVTTLYSNQIKSDDKSTYTICDVQVTQLNSVSQTFMAVVKRMNTSGTGCIFDVFAFRDSARENPVLAHTSYEPEFSNASIAGVQQKKYQITDEEYALAFEWTASQNTDGKKQETTMLCLFRVSEDMMQNIFEVCTYTNVGDDDITDEGDEFGGEIEDRASVETMKTWGKDLYSILVTRTQNRKKPFASAGERPMETKKTKILYQWDGMQFVQTNQLL